MRSITMKIVFDAVIDAASNDISKRTLNVAGGRIARCDHRIRARSRIRSDPALRVGLEPETGTDAVGPSACTSEGGSVHCSGSRRNPSWGSRGGV
jgi:hypothetical protein